MRTWVLGSVLCAVVVMGCTPKGPQRPPDLEAAHRRVAEQPDNAEGYLQLARLYMRHQDYLRARQYFGLGERLRPRDEKETFRLGVVLAVRAGQYDDAIVRCRRHLEKEEDPHVRVLLATVLESTGHWAEAEIEWQMVVAAYPGDPHPLIELARFYQRSARPDAEQRAAELYRRYLDTAPKGPEAPQARAALKALVLSEGEGGLQRTN